MILVWHLCFSCFFILFLHVGLVFKDGLRTLSEVWTEEDWRIPAAQYYILNFFIAFIALVFGSMVMFEVWFQRVQRISRSRQPICTAG